MRFTKMHGAGNDYVYVDCFHEPVPDNPAELARRVSDRHFGIGGDGLILILPSRVADARMWMFNADGSESEMCGNGIRCVAKYLYDHGICRKQTMQIETGAGVLSLDLEIEAGLTRRVRVDMGVPVLRPDKIPTTLPGSSDLGAAEKQRGDCPDFRAAKMGLSPSEIENSSLGRPFEEGPVVEAELEVAGQRLAVTCVSMGNPHAVTFVEQLTDDCVLQIGPKIEVDPHFPRRTNAEFVEVLSPTEVRMRVWERGSGETLACGTGATAVCVAGVLTGRTQRKILAHLPGGDLELEWAEDGHAYLTGPAVEVFSGEWHGSGE